jgi:hypothetical protein
VLDTLILPWENLIVVFEFQLEDGVELIIFEPEMFCFPTPVQIIVSFKVSNDRLSWVHVLH